MSRLKDVAKQVGLSPRYFHTVFKQGTGMTPAQYAKDCNRTGKDGVNSSATTLSSSAPGITTVTGDCSPLCGVGMNALALESTEHELSELVPTTPDTELTTILGMLQADDLAMIMSEETEFAVSHGPFDDAGDVSQFPDLNAHYVDIEGCLDTSLEYSCLRI